VTQAKSFEIQALTREYAAAHAEALIALNRDNAWDYWTADHLLSERPDKWRLSWVALSDGAPIGYAISSRREYGVHMHHLVVAPEWRSHGIGRKLLWSAANQARQLGISILTLKAYRNNTRAVALYEKLGFRVTAELKEQLVEMTVDPPVLLAAFEEAGG